MDEFPVFSEMHMLSRRVALSQPMLLCIRTTGWPGEPITPKTAGIDEISEQLSSHVPLLRELESEVASHLRIRSAPPVEQCYCLGFEYEGVQYQVMAVPSEFISLCAIYPERPRDLQAVLEQLIPQKESSRIAAWLREQRVDKRSKDYVYSAETIVLRFGWRAKDFRYADPGKQIIAGVGEDHFFGIRVVYPLAANAQPPAARP